MAADGLREWLLGQAERDRARQTSQALVETFPGTSQGRALPASPLNQTPGAGVPSVNVTRNPGAGEMIALTGTATIAGAGSGVVTQMDTIQAQVALPAVTAAGDTVSLRKAVWLAEVDIRWTDGYRGGGTVQITLGGTAIGSTWDDSGPWGRFVDTMAFPVSAQSAFDVKITPTDGAAHDAQVTVRVTLLEKMRTIAPSTIVPASTVHGSDESESGFNVTNPSLTVNTATAGAVAGDLLTLTASVSVGIVGGSSPTLATPSGYTLVASSEAASVARYVWVKTADSSDATGQNVTISYTGTVDRMAVGIASYDVDGATTLVADATSAIATDGGSNPQTMTATCAAGDWGVVVAAGLHNSSQYVDVTIDSPATQLLRVGADGTSGDRHEFAVGSVGAGLTAQATVTQVGSNLDSTFGFLVVLPMSGGTGGG